VVPVAAAAHPKGGQHLCGGEHARHTPNSVFKVLWQGGARQRQGGAPHLAAAVSSRACACLWRGAAAQGPYVAPGRLLLRTRLPGPWPLLLAAHHSPRSPTLPHPATFPRPPCQCSGFGKTCIIDMSGCGFPLFWVRQNGAFLASHLRIVNAGTTGNGGAVQVRGAACVPLARAAPCLRPCRTAAEWRSQPPVAPPMLLCELPMSAVEPCAACALCSWQRPSRPSSRAAPSWAIRRPTAARSSSTGRRRSTSRTAGESVAGKGTG
jgi:hypothetical protein